MLLILGLALFFLLSSLILFLPGLWAREIHHFYSTPRAVICPETHRQVGVTIDARYAAKTGLRGTPELRLSNCTRWPERARCAQACLPEALRNTPYTMHEEHTSTATRRIYHLPALLAAFAAWYVGMIWHSPHLFRSQWAAAFGLTPIQFKQIVESYSPHLITAGACLLFAYGVAWLQSWYSHQGLWQGILSSFSLSALLVLATLPSISGLPRELLIIEGGYSLVAAIVVGAIVGGLSGKLVLPDLTETRLEA
jgi:hypothetical protein